MKNQYRLAITAVMVATLAGCSGGAEQRRQANQDFNYLNTKPLQSWNVPAGAQLSQVDDYRIPVQTFPGALGREVDIRPPQQVLTLIPGTRVVNDSQGVTLVLAKQADQAKLWRMTQNVLTERNVPLLSQSENRIETDWVSWEQSDEDVVVSSRYRIETSEVNNQPTYRIILTDWREGTTDIPVSASNKERYSILMTNLMMARYDLQERELARQRAQELVKQIPISMGKDRSGLPVIIARAPYNVFWERLPSLLTQLGFTVEGRNRSQGIVDVEFRAPDDEFWTELGTLPIQLNNRSYRLQLGDLGNRTSINVTNTDGKPVTEAALESLAPVFAAAVERENQNKG
ncbi:outer membrane protein assembly factor BamC [Photobacterium sp. TY1-4]|uniref:outer membrane protein assembly factor BamC n=1 Tax=Photobacterium sp. TY1-4 TaxID=2899122 RepID=UPI0021C012EE|nr:outer membrane protein assembly factor BamC [Photobacterium sp. TY1-4]UXI01902.1 outer membrane protein assembly factor BamC [Photobacterium sp. TY1-4]